MADPRRAAADALPPLLAVLTRRTGDDARLRKLRTTRLPVAPQRELPAAPRAPGPRLPPPPSATFIDGAMLRPRPPLCHDAVGDTTPDPLGVPELYRELRKTFPGERLSFHHEPPVEPAAAADELPATERRNNGEPRQQTTLFEDYLRFVAATGSDFLHDIFHLGEDSHLGDDFNLGDSEEQPEASPPCPVPAEPYEKGLWKPVPPVPVPVGLEQLQRRLHRLWTTLGVPGQERLAMVVKYGASEALARLPAALEAWEAAAGDVLRRERLLAQLEQLEERASDPGRFFRGSTAAIRAEEAHARGHLHAALARCEARLSAALRCLEERFGDVVTYWGRPYAEKMRRDAVEMLYQLQQRRRAGALAAALRGRPPEKPPGVAGAETLR